MLTATLPPHMRADLERTLDEIIELLRIVAALFVAACIDEFAAWLAVLEPELLP